MELLVIHVPVDNLYENSKLVCLSSIPNSKFNHFFGLVIRGHHVHKVLPILSDGSDGYEEAGMKFLEDAPAHLDEHVTS